MVRNSLNRRDFSQYAAAALSGVAAGTLALTLSGCSSQPNSGVPAAGPQSTQAASVNAKSVSMDMHGCAGMNGCKGQGSDGKNACAGQGGCASTAMKHDCKGHNACKGQGGCAEMAGDNACKGQGGCAVPMKDQTAWQKARDKFEAKMKAAGKEVGPAPMKS